MSARFRHYRRKANLPEGINFHSLRHTFASWAAQRGMNLYTLKEIMGHADIKQTQVYASLSPATLQREMENAFGWNCTENSIPNRLENKVKKRIDA